MTIASRKEREKEQRRSDILQAAEKLFFARGYESVTMDDIAREVELNKATLYLYFKDKESLFFAVVLSGVRILASIVRERVRKRGPGIEKFWSVGQAYIDFAEQYPEYLRLYNYFQSGRFDLESMKDEKEALISYAHTGFALVSGDDHAKEIVALRQEMLAIQSGAIEQGIKEGIIRPDLDPVEVAVVYTLLLQSIPNMRLDLKKALEDRGIDRKLFASDIRQFMGNMILK
jgi:AcrR family transcriptional regulator